MFFYPALLCHCYIYSSILSNSGQRWEYLYLSNPELNIQLSSGHFPLDVVEWKTYPILAKSQVFRFLVYHCVLEST